MSDNLYLHEATTQELVEEIAERVEGCTVITRYKQKDASDPNQSVNCYVRGVPILVGFDFVPSLILSHNIFHMLSCGELHEDERFE